MLELVWKDVAAARWLLLIGLPIYAVQLAAMAIMPPVSLATAIAVAAALAFGSLAIEEIQGTDSLWASLPVSRGQIVRARYVTSILGSVVGLGISLVVHRWVMTLVAANRPATSTGVLVAVHVVLLLLLLTSATLLLPLCFRLGAGNGVLAFGALTIGGILALSLGGQIVLWALGVDNPLLDPGLYGGETRTEQARAVAAWLERWAGTILALWALLTAALLAASAAISTRIYEARDL